MNDHILEYARALLLPDLGKHADPLFWDPSRPMFFRSGRRWWRQDAHGNQTEAVDL
jgi:hypothetical protein